MIVPWLTSLDGTVRRPLLSIGPTGSWGDLSYTTRWGDGACGMFEASWTMALPPQFEHPLLRRGSLVELMDGSYRVGSPFVLSEPAVGTGFDTPWQFTATGIGRDVEGEDSFYAFSPTTLDATAIPSAAFDWAQAGGWRVASRASSVPTGVIGATSTTTDLVTVGALFNSAGQSLGQRWGVDSDNVLFFAADPTTPTYHVTPGAAALGTTDDGYASVVWGRYLDSATSTYKTVFATDAPTNARFGRKEYAVDLTNLGAITTSQAQAFTDGIMARTKGRLGWTNGLTLTSNEILTAGGVPADLSKVAEDVATGCMVRLHGIWDDLLEYTGSTWLDVILGEAKLVDGAQTIDLNPLGLAPRNLAAVIESVTGMASAA